MFAPTLEEMYPETPLARVSVATVSEGMEGEYRPGHFGESPPRSPSCSPVSVPTGSPSGRKDAQQLAVLRRLVFDLSFPVTVVEVSTVREPDGLALSSRNVFVKDRQAALGLSRGLFAAADAVTKGRRSGAVLEDMVRSAATTAGAVVEYATLADAQTAQRIEALDRTAFLAIAARVGAVRLIDNVVPEPDGTADRGTRLDRPSILKGS